MDYSLGIAPFSIMDHHSLIPIFNNILHSGYELFQAEGIHRYPRHNLVYYMLVSSEGGRSQPAIISGP